MLFNSHLFIFGFLPVTLAGFWLLRRRGPVRPALAWANQSPGVQLVLCSMPTVRLRVQR